MTTPVTNTVKDVKKKLEYYYLNLNPKVMKPTGPDYIQELSKKLGMDLAQHIEEFACAFYEKVDFDPRKVVMIQHTDSATGKNYYWFEKKRGRTRKQIIDNAKSP